MKSDSSARTRHAQPSARTACVVLSLFGVAGCSSPPPRSPPPPSHVPPLSTDYFSIQRRHLLAGEVEFIPCSVERGSRDWELLRRADLFSNLRGSLRVPPSATCAFRLIAREPEEPDDSLERPAWREWSEKNPRHDLHPGRDEEEVRQLREAEAERLKLYSYELQLRWMYPTSRGAMDARSNGASNVYTLTRAEQTTAEHAWQLLRDICPAEALRAGGRPALAVALLPPAAKGCHSTCRTSTPPA